MMASEQSISSTINSDSNKETMASKKTENGNCVVLQEGTETEEIKTAPLKENSRETEVADAHQTEKESDSGQQKVESPPPVIETKEDAIVNSQGAEIENGVDIEDGLNNDQNHSDMDKEASVVHEVKEQSTENLEAVEFSNFSAEISQTSEVQEYFQTVATCSISQSNKFHKVSDVEFQDSAQTDGGESVHDTSETHEKDSLEVSIDSDYGEHSEHEEGYLHEEIYDDVYIHESSEVVDHVAENCGEVSNEHSEKQVPAENGEMPEEDSGADLDDSNNDNDSELSRTPEKKEEPHTDKSEKRSRMVRPSTLGVQKTEQPYSTCTTETKIAMEIREMREREEELKLMREKLMSPVDGSPSPSPSSPLGRDADSQRSTPQSFAASPEPILSGPGYTVSSVFGHKGGSKQPQPEEDQKPHRSFSKESSVEKEIRLARSREEELRREKGLPPREDDSYVKPSQVKSSQVRVFSKVSSLNSTKEMATAKIQLEIEEQTMREMTLRDTGRIQTISQERTDSKVAKLKDLDVFVPECTSPTLTTPNGNGTLSDHSSKRSTPSPTGSSQEGIAAPVSRPPSQGKGISMQRFIASRGKESTFSAPRNGPLHPQSEFADASRSNLAKKPAKRSASVETKIQREILEMKLREEELRRLHSASDQSFLTTGENGTDQELLTNSPLECENSPTGSENEELSPSHNILIAKWEQRIQKSEGKA